MENIICSMTHKKKIDVKADLITGSEMLALDCFWPLSKGYWSRAPLPLQERTPSLVPTASFP